MKESFEQLVNLTRKLRGEGGCPWDKKQTIESMKKSILDEAQEVADAIDNKDMENLQEELGDLLFVIVFISNIAKEEGIFDLKDSLKGIHDKLIRRHPHIFGDKKATTADEALALFNEAKKLEKK